MTTNELSRIADGSSIIALPRTALNADVRAAPHQAAWHGRLAAICRWAVGFAEIVLLGLVVPLAVLLIGLPVAIVVRVIIELVPWL